MFPSPIKKRSTHAVTCRRACNVTWVPVCGLFSRRAAVQHRRRPRRRGDTRGFERERRIGSANVYRPVARQREREGATEGKKKRQDRLRDTVAAELRRTHESTPTSTLFSVIMNKDDYESLPTSSVAVHMTAGAIAGIMEHCVMYPFDSVKVSLAVPTSPRTRYHRPFYITSSRRRRRSRSAAVARRSTPFASTGRSHHLATPPSCHAAFSSMLSRLTNGGRFISS